MARDEAVLASQIDDALHAATTGIHHREPQTRSVSSLGFRLAAGEVTAPAKLVGRIARRIDDGESDRSGMAAEGRFPSRALRCLDTADSAHIPTL